MIVKVKLVENIHDALLLIYSVFSCHHQALSIRLQNENHTRVHSWSIFFVSLVEKLEGLKFDNLTWLDKRKLEYFSFINKVFL